MRLLSVKIKLFTVLLIGQSPFVPLLCESKQNVALQPAELNNSTCLEGTRLVQEGVKIGDGSDREEVLYKQALKRCPNLAEAHYNLGLLYHNRSDYERARTSFQKALDKKETSAFLLGLAHAEAKLGNGKEALAIYEQILKKSPDHTAATIGKSILLDKDNRTTEALEILENLVRDKPHETDLVFNIGVLYEKKDLRSEAALAYQKCLANDPHHFLALLYLGRLKHLEGDSQQSLTYLERARREEDKSPELHRLLGVVYRETGDLDRSELSFRKAIALAPDHLESRLNLAVILLARHQESIADEVLSEAAELDEKNARTFALQGVARYRLGRSKHASQSFHKALELDPTNQLAKSYLSLVESE